MPRKAAHIHEDTSKTAEYRNRTKDRMTSDHYIHANTCGAATVSANADSGVPGAGRWRGRNGRFQWPDEIFSPTRPATISNALKIRAADSASPMNTMPNTNAPTAPMPVHTA